ncbi:MAG: type II toxin-antitoxin system HigA family antitoxin [Burkholderiales bacterium]
MTPRVLKTGAQYREALQEIKRLTQSKPRHGSDAADTLELLSRLARDYEHLRLAESCPNPLSAIVFRMRQRGLRQKDLVPLVGGKNRASEILSGKRALTVAMIRELGAALDIPAEILLRESNEPAKTGTPSNAGAKPKRMKSE